LCHIVHPMDPTRLLLLLSTIAFVGGLVHAIVAIRAGAWRESRWHLVPMAIGFALQCAFLSLRGQAHGRCPLTNLFEVFIFIGWCIVLLYFLVGTTYRLSLLGVFTAPLVALLQTVSLLFLRDDPVKPTLPGKVNPWLELHASVALIAYAAFALACITGVMFLMQDHLLKRHRIHALFHQLPPIQQLSRAIVRMVGLGVLLLGVAMASTFKIDVPITNAKLLFSWGVLALYAAILLVMWRRTLGARHTAWLAVLGFLLPFVSLWIVTPKP
jgi:HemX protein